MPNITIIAQYCIRLIVRPTLELAAYYAIKSIMNYIYSHFKTQDAWLKSICHSLYNLLLRYRHLVSHLTAFAHKC